MFLLYYNSIRINSIKWVNTIYEIKYKTCVPNSMAFCQIRNVYNLVVECLNTVSYSTLFHISVTYSLLLIEVLYEMWVLMNNL